ncbi:MAG: hypothetical protein LBT08_00010 [Synergistaceae bacterium]|jgi:hypothetical protein|nr:hypothetical protein [Synergistaceae bacterium]
MQKIISLLLVFTFVSIFYGIAIAADDSSNKKGNVTEEGWTEAFASQSKEQFTTVFNDDVILVASSLVKPIQGREKVAAVLAAASQYYEYCNFTTQAVSGNFTFLEWDLLTHDGMKMQGVTLLEKNEKGEVVRAAIHHRPLGEVLLFSEHLKGATAGVIPEDHWYSADLYEKTVKQYEKYKAPGK